MAILRLAHVVQTDPDNRDALTRLCDALRRQGHLSTLAGLLEWWASVTTDRAGAARALTLAGTIHEREGNSFDAALALLRRALCIEPNHWVALRRLVAMMRARGDHTTLAAILTDHVIDLRSRPEHQRARAYFARELGRVHAKGTGDLEAALHAFHEALECAPDDRRITLELARTYAMRAGKRGSVERRRRDRAAAASLYGVLAQAATPAAARGLCSEALDLMPTCNEALLLLEHHARPEDREILRKRYEAFLEHGPLDVHAPRVRQKVIDLLLELGHYDAALEHVRALPKLVVVSVESDEIARACSLLPVVDSCDDCEELDELDLEPIELDIELWEAAE